MVIISYSYTTQKFKMVISGTEGNFKNMSFRERKDSGKCKTITELCAEEKAIISKEINTIRETLALHLPQKEKCLEDKSHIG